MSMADKTMTEIKTPDDSTPGKPVPERAANRNLTPAAQRALAEADERRRAAIAAEPPKEIGGRGGKDPARFGDWEIKGRAIDF